jgi:hypothetical protein
MVNNKKAAIEMSMNTIIVLVLGVSMLILGMVLIRNIMCSGLQITQDVSAGVRNEVKNLFGADTIGVKCMGEGSQDVRLGTGGQRKVVCLIKTESQADYKIVASEVKSLSGASTETVSKWVLNKEWSGTVSPGIDNEADFLLLNIPSTAPTTILRIKVDITGGESARTVYSTINIVPTGAIRGAIC